MRDGNPAAWIGLAFALVALTQFGLATPVRLTLAATILFVLLSESAKVAPALNRLATALRGNRPAPDPTPGGGGGGKKR